MISKASLYATETSLSQPDRSPTYRFGVFTRRVSVSVFGRTKQTLLSDEPENACSSCVVAPQRKRENFTAMDLDFSFHWFVDLRFHMGISFSSFPAVRNLQESSGLYIQHVLFTRPGSNRHPNCLPPSVHSSPSDCLSILFARSEIHVWKTGQFFFSLLISLPSRTFPSPTRGFLSVSCTHQSCPLFASLSLPSPPRGFPLRFPRMGGGSKGNTVVPWQPIFPFFCRLFRNGGFLCGGVERETAREVEIWGVRSQRIVLSLNLFPNFKGRLNILPTEVLMGHWFVL